MTYRKHSDITQNTTLPESPIVLENASLIHLKIDSLRMMEDLIMGLALHLNAQARQVPRLQLIMNGKGNNRVQYSLGTVESTLSSILLMHEPRILEALPTLFTDPQE